MPSDDWRIERAGRAWPVDEAWASTKRCAWATLPSGVKRFGISNNRVAQDPFYGHIYGMKTTMEIPDDLYRKLKARSAAQGKTVREVVVNLVQDWLKDSRKGGTGTMEQSADETHEQDKTAELRRWLDIGLAYDDEAPPGPSAMNYIREDRDRLDKYLP